MAFRRSSNRHDIWRRICAENPHLLRGLPPFAISSERAFRMLVTDGVLEDPGGGPALQLGTLAPEEIVDVWTFINYKTEMDMDASTFDALNELARPLLRG
jgi:hypothetical protein